MLEQSLGLNSGWQDARGASGGPSAIKNFYAPPTDGLPAPERTFLTEVDERLFTERVVLFDTGISRSATRGLNVVLDAYLSRDGQRYGAIHESLAIHDEMVSALRAGAYADLGRLANRYWQLRCILDPQATNDALQHLFENPQIADLTEGGLLTGGRRRRLRPPHRHRGTSSRVAHQARQAAPTRSLCQQQSGLLPAQCPRHPSRVRTAAVATKKEHLLIDGYNLIKASQLFQGRGDTLERARSRLQQALAAYGRRADKHITLYYDGTGESPNTTSTSGPHVTIEFSRYPQQADDLIAQAVEKKTRCQMATGHQLGPRSPAQRSAPQNPLDLF